MLGPSCLEALVFNYLAKEGTAAAMGFFVMVFDYVLDLLWAPISQQGRSIL